MESIGTWWMWAGSFALVLGLRAMYFLLADVADQQVRRVGGPGGI